MIFYLSASTASQFSWCSGSVSWLLLQFQDFLVFFFLDRTTSSPFLPISKEVILLMFSNSVSESSVLGLPRWLSSKESACQCRRCSQETWIQSLGKIPWRRAWHPTPVFLPGESHGQRSLVGYSPWVAESDTTARTCPNTHTHTHTHTRTHWQVT